MLLGSKMRKHFNSLKYLEISTHKIINIMRNLFSSFTFIFLFLSQTVFGQSNPLITSVPLAGNTFFSNYGAKGIELSKTGIINWTDATVSATVFVRFLEPGTYSLAIKAKTAQKCVLKMRIGDQNTTINVRNIALTSYDAGSFTISDTGYTAIVLEGLSKEGAMFANIVSIDINDAPEKFQYVKDDFYWGRRGPSVHLTYSLPPNQLIEWFYNEVTIPKGKDEIGSYYESNGFGEGYFGIQVNSPKERRVLFSVWSPFTTDDPKSIPDSLKIVLLQKGKDVHIGEFGNEGAGGQSYLRFNWQPDVTYKFLTQIKPNDNNSTTYTSYFYDPKTEKWLLIASFLRPKTQTWYTNPYSFVENFDPERGALNRKGYFGNQWACNTEGVWTELTKAKFTNDATARKKARMDFLGGIDANGLFFLSNGGFFSHYTLLNTVFERKPTGQKPTIHFEDLPQYSRR